jgi:hypothetical protein
MCRETTEHTEFTELTVNIRLFPEFLCTFTLCTNLVRADLAHCVSYRTPYALQYNLNVQHELASHTLAELAYSGRRGLNASRPVNINQQQYNGQSTYHALQARLERRFAQGLSFLTGYTWSKSIRCAAITRLRRASCSSR